MLRYWMKFFKEGTRMLDISDSFLKPREFSGNEILKRINDHFINGDATMVRLMIGASDITTQSVKFSFGRVDGKIVIWNKTFDQFLDYERFQQEIEKIENISEEPEYIPDYPQ